MKRTKKAIALAAFLFCAAIGGYTYRLGSAPQEPAVFLSAAMQGTNGATVVSEGVRGASEEDPMEEEMAQVSDEAAQATPSGAESPRQEAATPAPEATVSVATEALATPGVPSPAPSAGNAVHAAAPQVTVWASVGPEDTVSYGDIITYRGRVSGYEGTAWQLQWQRANAEGAWVDMEGETKPTLRVVLNQENEGARYRLMVIVD